MFSISAKELPFNHSTPLCKPCLLALTTEGTCCFPINVLFSCEAILQFMSLPLPSWYRWEETGAFIDVGILLILSWGCVGRLLLLPDVVLCSSLSYHDFFFSLSISMQLQKLKRSLSFKTIMRSKSVENFFQRSFSDARMPPDFITDPPPPSPPLLPGSPLVNNRSPSISPSVSPNPSISSHSPSLSLSPSLPAKPPHCQITHCFQDHVFRKPTNCQHCMNTIVGKEPIHSFVQNVKIECSLDVLYSTQINYKLKLKGYIACTVYCN